jgi:hypothetical protein
VRAFHVKTARFADVVKTGGVPEIHLTWTAPAEDPVLKRAIREHRLMTLHQRTRGARKDYGTVGFEPGPNVQFLVFPKTLRRFAGRKVVGVQYDLFGSRLSALSDSPGVSAFPSRLKKKKTEAARPATQPAKPANRRGKPVKRPPEPAPARDSRPASGTLSPAVKAGSESAGPAHASSGKPEVAGPMMAKKGTAPQDPVMREVWEAVRELRAGQARKSQKRLEALLDSPPQRGLGLDGGR